MRLQNLIELRPPAVEQIRQADLELLMLYLREMREAEKRVETVREGIKSALRRGARIEPGVHAAYLEVRRRGLFHVYEMLKVS